MRRNHVRLGRVAKERRRESAALRQVAYESLSPAEKAKRNPKKGAARV
jgi:hypothetical protein